MKTVLGRLRLASFLEGASFLALLWFAIYEKRIRGHEDAIKVPGMIHGVLFLLFCLFLLQAWSDKKLSGKRAGIGFLCSLLPFAPFWFERSIKKREQAAQPALDAQG